MLLTDLEKLFELKKRGILTEAEYKKQKTIIMNQIILENTKTPQIPLTTAYKTYWKKYFVWQGRSTRAELWWVALVNTLIALLLGVLSAFGAVFGILGILFEIVTFIPGISLLVRRMHDLGYGTWLALTPYAVGLAMMFISVCGAIADYSGMSTVAFSNTRAIIFVAGGHALLTLIVLMFILCCLPGSPKPNKYGAPK